MIVIMNKSVKNIVLTLAAAVMTLTACFPEANPAPAYEPAAQESGALVYFVNVPTGTVKLTKSTPSVDITLARASSELPALDVAITATGDATTYFNVPAKASFAADKKETKITVSAKDVNAMPMNEYYDLSLSVTDESLTSLYGSNGFSFKLGIELPWIRFSDGLLIEAWWGEEEPGKEMYYQQISDNLRYCKIDNCWGANSGPTYPVQPYVWYWNTETNYCYVPAQYMGYSTSSGDTYISDEAAFYNLYWNKQQPGKNGSGLEQGTDEWFAFHDARRAAWAPDGDPFPYYDGAGRFYLADWGYYMVDGAPTGSGFQFGGDQDIFVCSFAVDYEVAISYEGLLTDKDGNELVMGNLEIIGGDVTDVNIVIVPGKDALEDVEDALENAETEVPNSAMVVSEAGSFKLPMIEDAEDGFYTLAAVPVNGDGELEWDYLVYESFAYGSVDPLLMDYSGDDIIAGVSKEKLLGTQWIAFAGDSPADRAACTYVTFAEAEDNAAGDDLITCSGLANVPATAFDDTFTMEYYNGVVYVLGGQAIAEYNGYTVYAAAYDVSTGSLGGQYSSYAAYVADGIMAFVTNSKNGNFNSFGFFAVQDNSIAGAFRTRNYVLLVDPAILEEPSGVPAKAAKVKLNKLGINADNVIESVRNYSVKNMELKEFADNK